MPTYAVIGASGSVGNKVVNALSKISSSSVRAVVRDPEAPKSKALAVSPSVTIVGGSMSDPTSLNVALDGVDAVFINTPGAQDRSTLTRNALQASKRAGVKHVVIISVCNADNVTEIFGRQCAEIEADAKAAGGTPFTVLRLPFFLDNIWGNAGSIKGQSKIYSFVSPGASGDAICTDDIGEVAAVILNEGPAKHGGKTYNICGEPWSQADLAAAFSKALGRTVDYIQVPEASVAEAMSGFGFQKWQVDGCLELMRRIDTGTYAIVPSDVPSLLGRRATTMASYVHAIAGSGAF